MDCVTYSLNWLILLSIKAWQPSSAERRVHVHLFAACLHSSLCGWQSKYFSVFHTIDDHQIMNFILIAPALFIVRLLHSLLLLCVFDLLIIICFSGSNSSTARCGRGRVGGRRLNSVIIENFLWEWSSKSRCCVWLLGWCRCFTILLCRDIQIFWFILPWPGVVVSISRPLPIGPVSLDFIHAIATSLEHDDDVLRNTNNESLIEYRRFLTHLSLELLFPHLSRHSWLCRSFSSSRFPRARWIFPHCEYNKNTVSLDKNINEVWN